MKQTSRVLIMAGIERSILHQKMMIVSQSIQHTHRWSQYYNREFGNLGIYKQDTIHHWGFLPSNSTQPHHHHLHFVTISLQFIKAFISHVRITKKK